MPFDLEATTHRFESSETGLVQTVTANDPRDREQIALIREHLEEEAGRFAHGDFGDPATIHGHEMPGLAELRDGAESISIQFETRDDGARLNYTTNDPDLIEALHRWGAAQVSDHGDHGDHAEHGTCLPTERADLGPATDHPPIIEAASSSVRSTAATMVAMVPASTSASARRPRREPASFGSATRRPDTGPLS
jgi:hypothetical protein